MEVLVAQSCPILWDMGSERYPGEGNGYPFQCSCQTCLCPWDSTGKNTEMGIHSLLQGIFLTQGWNPGLLHCRRILFHLSDQGSPIIPISSVLFSRSVMSASLQSHEPQHARPPSLSPTPGVYSNLCPSSW